MKIFLTGGGGFLGKAIIRELLKRNYEVISYSRSRYPEVEKMGAVHKQGDLSDFDTLVKSMENCDAVFHVAANASYWGAYEKFYETNVKGTENIIRACRQLGIKKLVYTSSPSVVHDGKGIQGGDESLPYSEKFDAYYPQTKAIAEKMILKANDENLATVSLRPHLIWGPGDPHFLPRFLQRAKAGKLVLIGKRDYPVDCVFIDNAVMAHIQAFEKLEIASPVAGKAYFITQDEQIPISEFINLHLDAAGVPRVTKRIPLLLAHFIGSALEFIYRLFKLKGEPRLTVFLATQLSTPHWFNISAAKKDLGYRPLVSIDEGKKLLAEWVKNNKENISNS